jgi:hypothetical protein
MQGSFQMSVKSKGEYFRVLAERYRNLASKKERGIVVDEACLNTGLHRKSVIRALSKILDEVAVIPRPGRPRGYTDACIALLKSLYRKSGFQGSGKLRAMIPILIVQYKIQMPEQLEKEIRKIPTASIDRYLKTYRGLQEKSKRCHTRPGSKLFRRMIPLKDLTNNATKAGFMEADTVGHCGGNSSGEFAFSLTMTDSLSGWTENRGVLGKTAKQVMPAIKSIHESLPFDLISINVDNGSEFLNYLVYGYFTDFAKEMNTPFPMTRSRSYQKNDNARVEQKNWTHVRQLFGYDRFEDALLIPLMNEIYRLQGLITNYFIPQYRLLSKVRVGAKIKKKYDAPKTPYQRLLDSNITEEQKTRLKENYQSLSYPALIKEKEETLASFLKLHDELALKKRASPSLGDSALSFGNTYL